MIKVLDTSVIFRLYDDEANKELREQVRTILEKERVFIPCEVVIELSYLLKKALRKSKREVLIELEKLFLRDNVLLEEGCKDALSLWANSSLDKLVDAIILIKAKNKNGVLVTLDEDMENTYKLI